MDESYIFYLHEGFFRGITLCEGQIQHKLSHYFKKKSATCRFVNGVTWRGPVEIWHGNSISAITYGSRRRDYFANSVDTVHITDLPPRSLSPFPWRWGCFPWCADPPVAHTCQSRERRRCSSQLTRVTPTRGDGCEQRPGAAPASVAASAVPTNAKKQSDRRQIPKSSTKLRKFAKLGKISVAFRAICSSSSALDKFVFAFALGNDCWLCSDITYCSSSAVGMFVSAWDTFTPVVCFGNSGCNSFILHTFSFFQGQVEFQWMGFCKFLFLCFDWWPPSISSSLTRLALGHFAYNERWLSSNFFSVCLCFGTQFRDTTTLVVSFSSNFLVFFFRF